MDSRMWSRLQDVLRAGVEQILEEVAWVAADSKQLMLASDTRYVVIRMLKNMREGIGNLPDGFTQEEVTGLLASLEYTEEDDIEPEITAMFDNAVRVN